jgi:(p)ppGpp synthase/HD superfamily hydrolase
MNKITKIQKAIKFATKTHEVYQKQKRKGKDISYITHPLAVGVILASVTNDEDIICAGILHDTIEDSVSEKKVDYKMIEERFSKRVADLVLSVTEQDKDLSWEERKIEAIEHINKMTNDELLVKSGDAVANLSELVDDYLRNGDSIFSNFNAPKEKKLDNDLNVLNAILDRWSGNPFKEKIVELRSHISKML